MGSDVGLRPFFICQSGQFVDAVDQWPYCFDVLVPQRQLPVLGSDLISLLVHHFFELLHHLPLPLAHTCRAQGAADSEPLRQCRYVS